MSDIQEKVGDRIRNLRKQKGFSQENLASKSGLHRTYISDIERGSRNVSVKNLEKIARALGLSVGGLMKSL